MKKIFLGTFFFFSLFISITVFSQTIGIEGARPDNFTTFSEPNSFFISEELMTLTGNDFYTHPEFGLNPYDTPCEDCIELIDRRTENTRYYVKKGSSGSYFYKQTSSIDLHYKNEKGEIISIDARLKPTNISGIYAADQQNNPTKLNLLSGFSEMELMNDISFKFNRNLSLFSSNSTEGEIESSALPFNYSQYTVGDHGCLLINGWSGINSQMIYSESSIKTNFILNDLSAIAVDDKYTIIEDVLELPINMRVIYDQFNGAYNANGIWEGDLLLVDDNAMEFARFSRPVVYDADTTEHTEKHLFVSGYKIIEEDGNFRIQIYVNNSYLKDESRVFPIIIDPLVFTTTIWLGATGSNFSPAFCTMTTNVTTPANATLTNATLYWIVVADFLGDCGALAASRCYYNKAQIYFSTSCGTSPTGAGLVWVCAGACNFYGNWAPTVNEPSLVTCLTPQCASYNIPFSLHLNRIACAGGSCATNCIRATRFDVTIEGYTLEGVALTAGLDVASYTITDCITQSATFTADPEYGVGPYTYEWTPSGGTGATDTYVFPSGVTVVTLTVTDACGNVYTDNVTVTNPCVLPVTLTSFNGYHLEGKNYLSWTTETEQNSEAFIIERSFDGNSFESIGSVPAAGNSTTNLAYHFIDSKPESNIHYYRLKQLDFDGEYSYSSIIAIRAQEINSNSIVLNSSSLSNSELNLSVVTSTDGNGNFEIVDISGRIVYTKNIFLNQGINSVMLYTGEFATGTYILKFTKNDHFETIKFEMY